MNHLPECQSRNEDYGIEFVCICDALRACEQRVLDSADQFVKAHMEGKHVGFTLGVQAARDAVAGVTRYQDEGINGVEKNEDGWAIDRDEALSAIDALRQP